MKIYEYGKDNLDKVFNRSQLDNSGFIDSVRSIVADVKVRGDKALWEYSEKFDALSGDSLRVSEDEINDAYDKISVEVLSAIRKAKENVCDYHKRQLERFSNNIYDENNCKLGWMYRPLRRAGIYIPGGKASYPSSILMCALPAIVAGVEEVVLVTPNPKNPLTLVAARECGIKEIYKVGGAQAISALAYGTESIEKVDIIAGPGNVFVTLAKKEVYGSVAIDMIAGPSEILVICDETAKADFVASDLLSQAEHDELAASIMVTTSMDFAKKVEKEIAEQLKNLNRKEIINASLENNGAIIVVDNMETALKISDKIAPEHLEICTENAEEMAEKVKNAGAIFVGNYAPEPLGDYFAGPSHCLPTSGSARYFSVLSVDTFMKKISYINYTKDALEKVWADIALIAECEGLDAHANTVKIRFESEGKK